ncbi:MAG: insulinase family protein [Deltaproteobacteria bacterium]|nr:insulinase family protein [Deltaproteobacteria bacterium]
MRTLLSAFLFIVVLVGCAPNFSGTQLRPDELTFPPIAFHFPVVAKQQLANEMKVYVREDHELPLVDLTLMIEGGSIYDPLNKTGLSQLFADAMETGGTLTLSPDELEAELEMKAIELSVSSSAYCYEIDLSLHRKDLQRGLEILSDLLRRPAFDQERFELAQKQMLESIHRKNDDPGSIAGRLLAEAVNQGHPFGEYPTIDEVKSFTREDLIELHKNYFHPGNFWLAVSGAVVQDELIALLEQQFGAWPATERLIRDLPLLPQPPEGRVLLADKELSQTTILMGHAGINKDNPDALALRVANYILGGGGFNSRMMREVRSNRGLAYSVYSYFQIGRHLPELFIAGSETKCGTTAEVVALMRQLMQQIIDEPVSAAELELAKKSLINSFVFAFENSHSVVSRKVRLDFYGYPADYMETYRERVAAVTIADVQRVAQQYLRPQQLQIVLVGDSKLYAEAVNALGLPVEKVDL